MACYATGMNTSRGFAPIVLIIAIAAAVVLGGAGLWVSQSKNTASTASTTIEILGLDWSTQGPLPQVLYKVSNLPKANIGISLVGKADNKSVWSVEDVESSLHSGAGVLNLNTLTKFSTPVAVPAGTYFLRLFDFRTGALVAESEVFHIKSTMAGSNAVGPGARTESTTYSDEEHGFTFDYPANVTLSYHKNWNGSSFELDAMKDSQTSAGWQFDGEYSGASSVYCHYGLCDAAGVQEKINGISWTHLTKPFVCGSDACPRGEVYRVTHNEWNYYGEFESSTQAAAILNTFSFIK
jgi:hypothetical protein